MFAYLSLFVMIFCLIVATPSLAGGYFGVRGGISDVHEANITDEYVSSGFVSGYVGVTTQPFRGEIEYTYISQADYDDVKRNDMQAQFQRIMANGYIDIPITRYVRPYIGGGVGTAFYTVKDNLTEQKETGSHFAWNATAGVGIKLTRNLTFDSGYRYVDMGKVKINENELHFSTHDVYAGLRFSF